MRALMVALSTLFLALASAQPATAGMPAVAAQGELPSLAPMLEDVLPGVVSIAVHGRVAVEENPLLSDPFFRRFFGIPEQPAPQEREFRAAGSGVIVDPRRGYVITNHHVIEAADKITVVLSDGRRLEASKVGTDPATDIAVVRIAADGLKGMRLGDSDLLKVGDYVVAVGNPFGLEQTVTLGIVSALGRTGLGLEGYENFIQTDASINPGNSGGALVNLRGKLVGINSAIIGPAGGNVGIGFAIPINMARQVMDQLIADGKVSRGQLGITIQNLTPELARALNVAASEGALVAHVVSGSPAEQAGLMAGDVITAVNRQKVRNASDVRNKVGLLPVGSEVQLDIRRKGKALQVTATLAEARPERVEVPTSIPGLAGVTLGSIDPRSGLYGRIEGALVSRVEEGSPAARAGLRTGDIIVGVNQHPVASPQEVADAARKADGPLLLQVIRGGSGLFLVIG